MQSLQSHEWDRFKLKSYGESAFVMNPDGRIFYAHGSLDVELRRRLNTTLMDKKLFDYALQQSWIIIRMHRISSSFKIAKPDYNLRVYLNDSVIGDHFETFLTMGEFISYLESKYQANHHLPVRFFIHVFAPKRFVIKTKFTSSAAFANLFLHSRRDNSTDTLDDVSPGQYDKVL